jgi:hypothetical protein
MLLLAKAALGLGALVAVAGTYVFHEGVIRVDVDENRGDCQHVHFWVPATVVPVALHVVPRQKLERTAEQVRPFLPVLREVSKELRNYPNAELVDVKDREEHVRISVHDEHLYINVVSDSDNIHVSFPVEPISDVVDRLESVAPGV